MKKLNTEYPFHEEITDTQLMLSDTECRKQCRKYGLEGEIVPATE